MGGKGASKKGEVSVLFLLFVIILISIVICVYLFSIYMKLLQFSENLCIGLDLVYTLSTSTSKEKNIETSLLIKFLHDKLT